MMLEWMDVYVCIYKRELSSELYIHLCVIILPHCKKLFVIVVNCAFPNSNCPFSTRTPTKPAKR